MVTKIDELIEKHRNDKSKMAIWERDLLLLSLIKFYEQHNAKNDKK